MRARKERHGETRAGKKGHGKTRAGKKGHGKTRKNTVGKKAAEGSFTRGGGWLIAGSPWFPASSPRTASASGDRGGSGLRAPGEHMQASGDDGAKRKLLLKLREPPRRVGI